MEALKIKATPARNANVLRYLGGQLKNYLSEDEKIELCESVNLYRKGYLPLIVPISLVNHYVRKYDLHDLKLQYYLIPHPAEVQWRTHA